MVDAVASTAKVKLQQALHGYSEGHRQLAASVALKPRDAKTLLVLSDISGPGVRLDDAGYITGYPLPDTGLYALAKTWPAAEMSRPGCVWTHTLLIDFADLAALPSTAELLSLFRRPEGDFAVQFGQPLLLDKPVTAARIEEEDLPAARKILGGLMARRIRK